MIDTSGLVQTVVVTHPITTTTPSIRIQPSSFIPLQEMARSAGAAINITTQKQVGTVSYSFGTSTIKLYCKHSMIQTTRFHGVIPPNEIENSDCSWVCTVCQNLSVQKFRIITVSPRYHPRRLTFISLEFHLWYASKQCRPRSDIA